MRKLLIFLALALASTLALADTNVSLSSDGGTLTGGAGGLKLTGAVLDQFNGVTGNLGTMGFTTGGFLTGTPAAGGTLTGPGTITLLGDGKGGLPNAAVFVGSFSNLDWDRHANNVYTLAGDFTGKWFTGQSAKGSFILITNSSGVNPFSDSISVGSTDMSLVISPLTSVPEPSTLMFMGTGLSVMAFRLRNWTQR